MRFDPSINVNERIAFPENRLKNIEVTDEEVRERYDVWRAGKPLMTGSEPVRTISGKALALLQDIAMHPLRTTTQHYDALAWNPKIGNTVKDSLLRAGLVSVETVENGRSHMKFLKLTPTGAAVITDAGGTIAENGRGGIAHEYWRAALRTNCEEHGYTVTSEYDLGGRYVDLRATRNDRSLLLEVETGKSTVLENIAKCNGHGQLVVFFTTKIAYDAIREQLPTDTIALSPETINQLHTILE